MKQIKKIIEAVVEKILMASGFITSVTILLIVIFLFKEGAGLFSSPNVEEGYVLAVNDGNPVRRLTPEQIMKIYDAEITDWAEVGGDPGDITVFRLGDLTRYVTAEKLGPNFDSIPQCLSKIVASHPGIIAYFPEQYLADDFAGKPLDQGKIRP
ncbi:MAG: substrate-binding domain-containing protein, partial [Clostridium sp.]|nr:substrate-binding domain-containing protein [Clostridium sp.]